MLRRLLVVVHRWFGLAAAAFLCVAGLTGALIAWSDELDAALNPALFHRAASDAPKLAASELVRRIERQDARLRVSYLPLALAPGENWLVWVEPRVDPVTHRPFALDFDQVFADAATGRVLASREWGAARLDRLHLMPFLYKLHYSLQLPEAGGIDIGVLFMGALAIAWVIDTLIALWLSFPSLASWRRSLAFRWSGGAAKLAFDLHRSGGVWLFALVLTVAVTSVSMNLGADVMRPIVSAFSALAPSPYEGRPAAAPGRDPVMAIGLDEAVRRASVEAARHGWVEPAGAASIQAGSTMIGVAFFRAGAGRGDGGLGNAWIYVDATDGHVVAASIPGQGSAGDVFLQAMFPLHSGRIAGLAGRVAISAMGALVAMLSFTGILLWVRRRRAKALTARHPDGRTSA